MKICNKLTLLIEEISGVFAAECDVLGYMADQLHNVRYVVWKTQRYRTKVSSIVFLHTKHKSPKTARVFCRHRIIKLQFGFPYST